MLYECVLYTREYWLQVYVEMVLSLKQDQRVCHEKMKMNHSRDVSHLEGYFSNIY